MALTLVMYIVTPQDLTDVFNLEWGLVINTVCTALGCGIVLGALKILMYEIKSGSRQHVEKYRKWCWKWEESNKDDGQGKVMLSQLKDKAEDVEVKNVNVRHRTKHPPAPTAQHASPKIKDTHHKSSSEKSLSKEPQRILADRREDFPGLMVPTLDEGRFHSAVSIGHTPDNSTTHMTNQSRQQNLSTTSGSMTLELPSDDVMSTEEHQGTLTSEGEQTSIISEPLQGSSESQLEFMSAVQLQVDNQPSSNIQHQLRVDDSQHEQSTLRLPSIGQFHSAMSHSQPADSDQSQDSCSEQRYVFIYASTVEDSWFWACLYAAENLELLEIHV